MLAFFRKHWVAFVAAVPVLPSIWRSIVQFLDWGGRVDLVANKLHEIGGMTGILAFLLNPPPWLIWPALATTGLLLLWDRGRTEPKALRGPRAVSFWGPWILIVGGPLLGCLWLYLGRSTQPELSVDAQPPVQHSYNAEEMRAIGIGPKTSPEPATPPAPLPTATR